MIVDLAPLGMGAWLEPRRGNRLPFSCAPTAWSVRAGAYDPGARAALIPHLPVSKWVETAEPGRHSLTLPPPEAPPGQGDSAPQVFSCFVKPAERTALILDAPDGPRRYDLAAGQMTSELAGGLIAYPQGVCRLWARVENPQGESFRLTLLNEAGDADYRGTPGAGLWVVGLQLEAGPTPGALTLTARASAPPPLDAWSEPLTILKPASGVVALEVRTISTPAPAWRLLQSGGTPPGLRIDEQADHWGLRAVEACWVRVHPLPT